MIICAALKIEQCKDFKETIVPCFRHGSGYEILFNLCNNTNYKKHVTEGFITHTGEFLNREDAFDHAMNCGQLSVTNCAYKAEHGEHELYSEDLY